MSEQMKLPLTNKGLPKGKNLSKHPLYNTWRSIIADCTYKRGIGICDQWKNFNNFVRDVGSRPENARFTRLDRLGIWGPENCGWIMRGVQGIVPLKQAEKKQPDVFKDDRDKAEDTKYWKDNFDRLRKALPQTIEHALSEKMKWTVLEEASKLAIRGNWLSAYNLIQRLF
jgi:hypothetical protein